jgi:uncharacterized iron-regulated membrane protein
VGRRRRRRRADLVVPPAGGRPGRRRLLGWHGAVGVWLSVALLFISATGLTWSHYAGARFQAGVEAVKGSTPALAAEVVPVRDTPLVPVQTVLDNAHAAGLTGLLVVTVPQEPGAPYTVAENAGTWPVQRDAVTLDPYTGAVTETVLWRDWPVMAKLTRIGILAHMGSLFGLVSQLALAAMAVGLLCLLCWGYLMWWRRRPTRDGRARLTPLAAPGSLRALTQPAAFAVVLATVAVGWLLPVLGVSLLVFLAGDTAVGALTRRRAVG